MYIRFSSCANVQIGVDVSTRSSAEQPVGILGIGTQVKDTLSATLVGCDTASLRRWMKNDMYLYSPYSGLINHAEGYSPTFPIDTSSAVVAYAYMPYSDSVRYDNPEECYIPIDLIADGASTDWMYSGKTAKSKADYLVDQTFAFRFEHAMTCLEFLIEPDMNSEENITITEISLGVYNSGKGRLSLIDGEVVMDTASWKADSVYCIKHNPEKKLSNGGTSFYTETFYLMPYTLISDLSIVGVWNDGKMSEYKFRMEGNSKNLGPGSKKVFCVNKITKEKQ